MQSKFSYIFNLVFVLFACVPQSKASSLGGDSDHAAGGFFEGLQTFSIPHFWYEEDEGYGQTVVPGQAVEANGGGYSSLRPEDFLPDDEPEAEEVPLNPGDAAT